MDRAVDLFAAEIGLDPVEVRRRNLLRPDEFPWKSADRASPTTAATTSAPSTMALAASRLRRAPGRAGTAPRATATRELLGIGVSVFIDRTAGVPGSEYGAVELQPDGRVLVRTGSSPYGQGHYTAWAMLVADRTGLPIDRIEVVHGDTDVVPRGGVTGGSRSAQKAGSAVAEATDALVVEASRIAADLLEAARRRRGARRRRPASTSPARRRGTVGWAEVADPGRRRRERQRGAGTRAASPPPAGPLGAERGRVEVRGRLRRRGPDVPVRGVRRRRRGRRRDRTPSSCSGW